MPYTASQNKLFRAAAHNPAIAKKHGLSQATASRLASEGVKKVAGAMQRKGMRR
jgi:hypothetical protein